MIDCHTHWHPDWNGVHANDPSRWLAVLDRHGVERAAVLPTRGLMDDTLIEADNNDVASVCRASHGRMIPFCTARIWQGDRALAEIDRCLGTLGFRGIKFHTWIQGMPVNHPVMDAICERAAAANVPILFHDGTPPFSLPSQIGLLARRHPRTTLILGHCGLLEFWEEAIAVLRLQENVWGCLCSPHPAAMREVAKSAPRERLCWGSDFGFGQSNLVNYRLRLFHAAGLDSEQEDEILRKNPLRLFGTVELLRPWE